MSQRFPSHFDGLVAGAPAMRTGYSNLGMRWMAVALNEIAARDAGGNVVPGSALSDGDKQLIVDSVVEACDAEDGLEDGMIFAPRVCDFSPVELVCGGAKDARCLTRAQASAVEKALSGPRGASGLLVYPGYFYDTGIAASGQGVIPGVLHGAASPVGPRVPPTTQDVDTEAAIVAGEPSSLGDTNGWTNLSTFRGHGGKLLFYHGISDPWFSAKDTIEYYEKLGDDASSWSRLLLVPGMGHCRGGPALDVFDLLSAVVDWVEKGAAPESVTATGDAFPGRSRPLCAYPEHAHYLGRGDPDT